MTEAPGFMECAGRRLFAVFHDPAGAQGAAAPLAAVLVHPFAEEKVIAQRPLVLLARALAARGVAVLRFDLSGCGDSEGEFEDATVEQWVAEACGAVREIRGRSPGTGRICLIGLRFGATLAALAARREGVADSLVLVSPIVGGKPYMEQCLRGNLTTQMMVHGRVLRDRQQLAADLLEGRTVNVDGHQMGPEFYRQALGVDLAASAPPRVRRALILGLEGADAPFRKALEQAAAAWSVGGAQTDCVYLRDEPPWKDPKTYGAGGASIRETVVGWLTEERG